MSAGLAEVIKYGCIMDAEFFSWLEAHIDALRARDPEALLTAIYRSCELKAQVVAQDEREAGLREILNFGHTFGHAIEVGHGYGKWLHGEAVGCGMVMAAHLSHQLGAIVEKDISRIKTLVTRAGLPTIAPNWPADDYLAWMAHDKKAKAGKIRYVVLRSIGAATTQVVDDAPVRDVIQKSIA